MPHLSIVTAVYNVAPYLDEFSRSFDNQTLAPDEFEVIAVDDGSTDSSLEMLHAWAARAPYKVVVLTKENGGQSTARNEGLPHARGEWVTFCDPDDALNDDYLKAVSSFVKTHPRAVMVACNLMILRDETGVVEDSHPMRHRFEGKSRVRDLESFPGHFFGSVNAAFFQRSVLEERGLLFDPDIRPNFEDGEFAGRYLLGFPRPFVGFVREAHYHYRKRPDSTLGLSIRDGKRYTTVVEKGYLGLLEHAVAAKGIAPLWAQNIVLYELSWLISLQSGASSSSSAAVREAGPEFHRLMKRLLDLCDRPAIEGTPVRRINPLWRDVLMHAWHEERWRSDHARLTSFDGAQRLVKFVYRYLGEAPVEVILANGQQIAPAYAKVRDVELLGRVVMHERIVWVPAGTALRVLLDGAGLDLRLELTTRPMYLIRPGAVRASLQRDGLRRDRTLPTIKLVEYDVSLSGRALLKLAASRGVRKRYGRAWVLMDRIRDADDNGERLFEYLRKQRPEINAFFVLSKESADWPRMEQLYGDRLVAYGSRQWKLLLLNAEHLLSSHIDVPIVRPVEIVSELGVRPTWRFTFLQHGVIKDDLSNWLNPKDIDTFVVSTRGEYESVVAEHSPYIYTERETKLTGLPRFDRLREIDQRLTPADRNLVLLAPTWRNWLSIPNPVPGADRTLMPGFRESEFVTSWLNLLGSPELAAAVKERGLKLGFLPHPDLQSAMRDIPLPEGVELITFAGNDVQEIFARAAVLVTDYSSMAFNGAYLDRPLVYFQFDRERVLAGEHLGRRGYFDYVRDGFGPVAETHEEAVTAIVDYVRSGVSAELYTDRVEAAFPLRDGRCCERVTEAVIASTKKYG